MKMKVTRRSSYTVTIPKMNNIEDLINYILSIPQYPSGKILVVGQHLEDNENNCEYIDRKLRSEFPKRFLSCKFKYVSADCDIDNNITFYIYPIVKINFKIGDIVTYRKNEPDSLTLFKVDGFSKSLCSSFEATLNLRVSSKLVVWVRNANINIYYYNKFFNNTDIEKLRLATPEEVEIFKDTINNFSKNHYQE